LFAAFAEILEWLFDRAQVFAREYPEEVAAVERIRVFVRRNAGDPAPRVCAHVEDLLFTLGLIAGALEQQRQRTRGVIASPALAVGSGRLPMKRAQVAAKPAVRIRRPS
jgi:hypothetical protein